MAAAAKRKPALRVRAPARNTATSREQTEATVLVLIAVAAQATRDKDIDGLIGCLRRAIEVYERHPGHAQAEGNQLRSLIMFVQSARGLADTRRLETRAAALRRSIH
jgi:hypothetical protein